VCTAGLRDRLGRGELLVCDGLGEDGGGLGRVDDDGGNDVDGEDVVGVGVGDDEDEDVLGAAVELDVLLLGAVVVGVADAVGAFAEVISWWVGIATRGFPARKLSMKVFQVRPGMSRPYRLLPSKS